MFESDVYSGIYYAFEVDVASGSCIAAFGDVEIQI